MITNIHLHLLRTKIMLDFTDMETKRLCDIVNVGAGNRLNDREFLERELSKWLTCKQRRFQMIADGYYNYEQAIKLKKRMVIADGGKMAVDPHLPNNRFMDNRYADMVDQKVNYLLAKPLTFKTDNQTYADALKLVFNKSFYKTFKNLGKDTYNGGIGWLYPYYDEQGNFKIRKFKPYEILPFWSDDDHTQLDFAVRYYEMLGYQGHVEHVYRFVEVYDTKGIHKFTYENGGLRPDYQTYYFERPDLDGELIPYNWDRVPLIAFKANNNETSLLKKCKSLQDGINEILSNFGDGMQENASGNSVLVLKNYGGENLGEFRRNLSQYKAVKVTTVDGADGGVDTLQIEVNAENYLTILAELRKALIHNCRGYDVDELKSAGSPNEMTIKSVYSQIDLDANELETEFQASFEELLWFVNQHLANVGVGNFDNEKVEVIFDRDLMINESQVIQDVNASASLLSKRTLLSQHPWITDVEKELKELDKEEQKQMEQFGNSQFIKPVIGEEDAE